MNVDETTRREVVVERKALVTIKGIHNAKHAPYLWRVYDVRFDAEHQNVAFPSVPRTGPWG
jgi:hypothetical protein